MSMYEVFKKECEIHFNGSQYANDADVIQDLKKTPAEMNMKVLKNIIVNYVEDIKNKYMSLFLNDNN